MSTCLSCPKNGLCSSCGSVSVTMSYGKAFIIDPVQIYVIKWSPSEVDAFYLAGPKTTPWKWALLPGFDCPHSRCIDRPDWYTSERRPDQVPW